jgi:hypothetical protein
MALANFFEKTATAAAQVLEHFDLSAFRALLERTIVGIGFDETAATSREGVAALELAANLLARLYPRLALVALSDAARPLSRTLARLAKAINPDIEISNDLNHVQACLVAGNTAVQAAHSPVYVGSRGWVVHLSPSTPVGSGATDNPFGAGAAACFGAANVFRSVFSSQLPNSPRDAPFTLSLLDYVVNAAEHRNPTVSEINIGEIHLVGLGAIGNGAVWALARLQGLSGMLHLIDHEKVELSNLQRYVLTTQKEDTTVKVDLAERVLRRAGLIIRPHPCRWSEYLSSRSDMRLERVAIAVDTAEDRIGIQASLPRWIINAWTQADDLGISRHDFVGTQACLACLYLPEGMRPNEDEVVAKAIRMPEAIQKVRELLYTNSPIGREFVELLAVRWGVPSDALAEYAPLPIRTFYVKAVCGGMLFQIGQGGTTTRVAVPLAFQSALAGIMLAAELVSHAAGQAAVRPTTTRINLLRPLGKYLSQHAAKHRSNRCLCQDQDYTAAYQAKYGITAAEILTTPHAGPPRSSQTARKRAARKRQ